MHLGGGHAESPGPLGEVFCHFRRPHRNSPGVFDPRQEFLSEGEVSAGDSVGHPAICPEPRHVSDRSGCDGAPGSAKRFGERHIRIVTVMKGPEDLADDRSRRCAIGSRGVENDRGVGLLPGQHAR